jgi:hypothetical protein
VPSGSKRIADTPPSAANTAAVASVTTGGRGTSTGGGFSLFDT